MKTLFVTAMVLGGAFAAQAFDDDKLGAAREKAMGACLMVEPDVQVCECGFSEIGKRADPTDLLLIFELAAATSAGDPIAAEKVLKSHGLTLDNEKDQIRMAKIGKMLQAVNAICKPALPKPTWQSTVR